LHSSRAPEDGRSEKNATQHNNNSPSQPSDDEHVLTRSLLPLQREHLQLTSMLPSSLISPSSASQISVNVQTPSTNDAYVIQVARTATFSALRTEFEQKAHVSDRSHRITFAGVDLLDSQTLDEAGIEEDAIFVAMPKELPGLQWKLA